MKKILPLIILLGSLLITNGELYIEKSTYSHTTETFTIQVYTDEPWELYRSSDGITWEKIKNFGSGVKSFTDNVAGKRDVYYFVSSKIKKNWNTNKPPEVAWGDYTEFRRQYFPE